MQLGVQLTLLIGPTVPLPAPITLTEALNGVEVTHNDSGRSGFQLSFQIGRSGPLDIVDYDLLSNPLLRPFNRVILMVHFNLLPIVLMDGIITNIQLSPSNEPGGSTLSATGEDVSVMMDLHQVDSAFPGMDETAIVTLILAKYAQFLITPLVIPPLAVDFPLPSRQIPNQLDTDLGFINTLAGRYGYVFFVKPGLVPGTNIAYWGPPLRTAAPQRALSFNMGPDTNVDSISFSYDALAPTQISMTIQDSETNQPLPVITPPIGTRFPLSLLPALPTNLPNVRTSNLEMRRPDYRNFIEQENGERLTEAQARSAAGLSLAQAMVRAQGQVDASLERVVTANGELDTLRYGGILEARSVIGMRGVGLNYDGLYYVKSVSHSIRRGGYKQRFSLTREGVISNTPAVIP